jgi:hypothetical protein
MPRSIPLTKGKAALVDDDQFAGLSQYRWRYASSGYAVRTVRANGRRRHIFMHRQIMAAQPGQLVDHIDHDRLDNRRENLRFGEWQRLRVYKITDGSRIVRKSALV